MPEQPVSPARHHSPAVRTALIIGSGIAGPVTAVALAKAGVRAEIAEAYPEPTEGIGGSLALAPNGMAALSVIGADAAVRERALPIVRSTMSVADRVVGDAPRLADQEPLQMIDRGSLHGALRDVARRAGVRTAYGRRLVSVTEHPDHVTARFDDGSQSDADVLIGADGARSTVRRLIDPAAPSADYTGMLGFEGRAYGVETGSHPGEMVFAFGRQAYYLYWPNPDGSVGWGANLPSDTYLSLIEARRTPDEDWLATLRRTYAGDDPGSRLVAGTAPEDLQAVGALHIMPPVPHWSRGRLVLVGDAVHAPSNSTGQGASLAIESGVELAQCLRDRPDPAAAFAAYELRRRSRVEAIARRGATINRAKTPGPFGRAVMRLVMPLMLRSMSRSPALADEQRFRIDWAAPVH